MALAAAKKDEKYKKVMGNAAAVSQETAMGRRREGKKPEDEFYGGAGYDSKSRPDLSNTQFFIDALKDAGVAKDDEAFKKVIIFVSRCQNLKSEHNQHPVGREDQRRQLHLQCRRGRVDQNERRSRTRR